MYRVITGVLYDAYQDVSVQHTKRTFAGVCIAYSQTQWVRWDTKDVPTLNTLDMERELLANISPLLIFIFLQPSRVVRQSISHSLDHGIQHILSLVLVGIFLVFDVGLYEEIFQ
ncbi:MAG TPA: hypothetical protein EYN66_03545 [Myxococcales bacterium]|nr:hypothetical protein [Myxococcales bacterium]